jgi:hypothetical protein
VTRLLLALLLATPWLAPAPARGVAIDVAASALGTAEVADLSAEGLVAFELAIADAAPIALAIELDPADTAAPLAFEATLLNRSGRRLAAIALSVAGTGVAFGAVGDVSVGVAQSAAPAPQAGVVTIPIDPARVRWLVEIGRAAGTAAQPWTIDAGALGPPHRFTLHVAPSLVPEPSAAGLALAAIAALGALARRRRSVRAAPLGCAVALAFATAAPAATVTITSSADSGAGSLRAALAGAVQPGDTIAFAVPEARIGALPLVVAIPNVTLQGPVALRPSGSLAALDVRANGVSLLGVTLDDVQLAVGSAVTLAGFTLSGSTLTGNAPVFVERIAGCAITGNTFSAVDPAGRSNVVLALELTDGCSVTSNTITSPLRWHIEDDNGTALTLHDNNVAGSIQATPRSGSITSNGARELFVLPPDGAHGALLVEDNQVGRLRVVRTNLHVRDNVVDPALRAADLGLAGVAAALASAAKSAGEAGGSFSAQGNTGRGGRTCVLFNDWAGPVIPSDLTGNTITGCTQRGLLALGPDGTEMIANSITGHGGPGVVVGGANAYGRIEGGAIRDNGGAGVFVDAGARVEITGASFEANAGPGIDLAPGAVTPNDVTKTANGDLDWPDGLRFDAIGGRLLGLATPGARVEVYVVESGARLGNPNNGEGVTPLGTTLADGLGNWAFPDEGTLGGVVPCDEQTNLTATATVLGAVTYTSEFSPDYDCSDPPLGVDLGGGAFAACENPATCAIGPGGGTCFACTLWDGAFRYRCDAGEPCSYSATGTFSCGFGCEVEADAVHVECSDGCQRAAGDGLTCEGGPNGCALTVGGQTAARCPADRGCEVITDPAAAAWVELGEVATVEVRKESEGGDGTFRFEGHFGDSGAPRMIPAEISTAGGVGTRVLQFVHAAYTVQTSFDPLEVVEPFQDGWVSTGVTCEPTLGEISVISFPPGVRSNLLPGARVTCTFRNQRTGPDTLVDPGVDGPDALAHTNTFGLPPGDRVVVGGSNGLAVVAPLSGTVPTVGNATLAFLGVPTFSNLIGALVIQHPTVAEQDAFFGYGTGTGFARVYVPQNQDFGSTLALGSGFTDAVHLGNDPSQEAIAVRSSGGGAIARFRFFDFGGGQYFPQAPDFIAASTFSGIGTPISAYADPSSTRVLVAMTGTPGKLVIADPALQAPFGTVTVGNLGDDPRRVRCLAGVCAISNRTSNTLTLALWDGGANASITGTTAVGDGPVGVDLRALAGGTTAIASTGFDDDSYTITVVDSAAAVVASATTAVPEGCSQPSHPLWLGDAEQHLVVSCFGSGNLAVFVPEIPEP